jgi:hypothetical protein
VRATLVQDLEVVRFAAFAEMAWMDSRPELREICKLAEDSGERITGAVVQQALPGLSDTGSDNVIAWCRDLGLCDAHGALLELGRRVADTGEAPIPEQGVYDFWLTSHPVLGRRVLHVDRIAPVNDKRFSELADMAIVPELGQPCTSVVDKRRAFVVRGFPANHGRPTAVAQPTTARCQLEWLIDSTPGVSGTSMKGSVDTAAGEQLMHSSFESREADLESLMRQWASGPLSRFGSWIPGVGGGRLEVAFDGLPEAEQDTFLTDLELGAVDTGSDGHWGDARLTDVPIRPRSAPEAQKWAEARLNRHLRGSGIRHTRADVRREFAERTEDTPLAEFLPELPSHASLVEGCRGTPELYWRLAASVDLAPFPTPQQELAAMPLGQALPQVGSSPEDPASVVVPYRGGWSMQTLLDRLIGSRAPRRVLLVDRYVRGQQNLVALAVVMATLRRHGAVTLDVWTGTETEDRDIAEITRITGRAPRHYGAVFGRDRLHDRYLIVVPEAGACFGWQMSNSPLDARSPDGVEPSPATPLRWRDLAASRLARDQMHDEMAKWATAR